MEIDEEEPKCLFELLDPAIPECRVSLYLSADESINSLIGLSESDTGFLLLVIKSNKISVFSSSL